MKNLSRSHALVCYSLDTVSIIERMSYFEHITWICHDRDIDENGELKKTHFHLLVYTLNAKTSSAVIKAVERELLKKFGKDYFERSSHDSVFAEFVRDINGIREYLTHSNATDKFLYPEIDIKGDYEWWLKNSGELQKEIEKSKTDWTLCVFSMIKSNPLRSTYILREDIIPLLEDFGRDIMLNLKRVMDTIKILYPALCIISKDEEEKDLKDNELRIQLHELRNAGLEKNF